MSLNLYTTPIQNSTRVVSPANTRQTSSPASALNDAAAPSPSAPASSSTGALDAGSPNTMVALLSVVMLMMTMMLKMAGQNAFSGSTSPTDSTPATGYTPPTAGTVPVGQVPPSTQSNLQATGGTAPLNIFTQDDYKNFLLAGSQGGTAGTSEGIFSKFADQNSRFARTSNSSFQGAIAGMYANQFKAYALGLDAAFTPGKDINQLSANLVKAQNTQMTPEAEILSKVAAVYRGNLTGANLYDNGKLKDLLVKWGRSDIANQPNVGDPKGDVQSIGGVIKALNEEKDPAVRQAWLQQIFDFAGNSPSSPSGAVPNVAQYQQAIDIVRGGQLDQLLNGYLAT